MPNKRLDDRWLYEEVAQISGPATGDERNRVIRSVRVWRMVDTDLLVWYREIRKREGGAVT